MNKKAWAFSNAVRLMENKLDNLKMEYDRTEADLQTFFRKFVTDKQFPLADRFKTWARHCTKEHPKVPIRDGDFGIIGQMVAEEDDCYQREVTYSWDHFLTLVADRNEHPDEYDGDFPVTVNDLKEVLIAENFGSFTEDW